MSALRLSVAGVMLLAALALGLIIIQVQKPASVTAQSVPPPLLMSYFVAAHQLPPGTLAREEDFTTRAVASADLPRGAIVDTPDARTGLRGALIRNFLDTGSLVTSADVLRPRDRGFLASVLEPGTRAISVGVDAVTGVAGLIWPGDHVDVVLTHEIEKANLAHRSLSQTVLANVRVIAIDQEIVQGVPANNTSAGKTVRTVTLQVATPSEVERITVAEHLGKLSLSIRSATDQPEVDTRDGVTFAGDVSPSLGREGAGASVLVVEGDKTRQLLFPVSGGAPVHVEH
jgi:pilus assembly protein CpaB